MDSTSVTPTQRLEMALNAAEQGWWNAVLVRLFGEGQPYSLDRLACFDTSERRQALWLAVQALRTTGKTKELVSFLDAILKMGPIPDHEMRVMARAYMPIYLVGGHGVDEELWQQLSRSPHAHLGFADYLRDAGQLREAYGYALRAREMGASTSDAQSLIDSIWRQLPEGRLALAQKAATKGDWKQVIQSLFDDGTPRLAGLSSFQAGEEKQAALRLVASALLELRRADPLPEFLSALDEVSPLDHGEALAFAAAIEKSADSFRVGQLYRTWSTRFSEDAILASALAAHCYASGSYNEALDEARRALALGADEPRCRRLMALSLKELHRPHEAMAELALLYESHGWSDEDQQVYEQLKDAIIPGELQTGREQSVSLIKQAWWTFQKVGTGVGRLFGGGDPRIPHRKEVLQAAPRLLRPDQIHAALDRQELSEALKGHLLKNARLPDAAVAGGVLTLSSVYWLGAIDQRVLDAITFSTANQTETLSGLQSATSWFDTSDGDGLVGHFSRLVGYVAEQQVAIDAAAAGYEVSFPDTSNQPGWDLLVDGVPFQVKLGLDPGLVYEHLQQYPDIPVIVNRELAPVFAGHDSVVVDNNLSYAEVHEATTETLGALDGSDLLDLKLPLVTIGISMVRHSSALFNNKIDLNVYGQRVFNDALFRGGGGIVAAKAGFLAGGAVAGPLGGAIAAIVAGMVGATAGGALSDRRNLPRMCEARDDVVQALGSFAGWFEAGPLRARLQALWDREKKISAWALRARATEFPPEVVSLYESLVRESRQRTEQVGSWLRAGANGDADGQAHAGWHALNEAPLFVHPEISERVKAVQKAVERYSRMAQAEA